MIAISSDYKMGHYLPGQRNHRLGHGCPFGSPERPSELLGPGRRGAERRHPPTSTAKLTRARFCMESGQRPRVWGLNSTRSPEHARVWQSVLCDGGHGTAGRARPVQPLHGVWPHPSSSRAPLLASSRPVPTPTPRTRRVASAGPRAGCPAPSPGLRAARLGPDWGRPFPGAPFRL